MPNPRPQGKWGGETQVCGTAGGRWQGLEGRGVAGTLSYPSCLNQEPLMYSPHPSPWHTAWPLSPHPGLDCSLRPYSFASPANPCQPTPAPPAVITPHLSLTLPGPPKPRLGSGFDLEPPSDLIAQFQPDLSARSHLYFQALNLRGAPFPPVLTLKCAPAAALAPGLLRALVCFALGSLHGLVPQSRKFCS